jgi:hypothetical protein
VAGIGLALRKKSPLADGYPVLEVTATVTGRVEAA